MHLHQHAEVQPVDQTERRICIFNCPNDHIAIFDLPRSPRIKLKRRDKLTVDRTARDPAGLIQKERIVSLFRNRNRNVPNAAGSRRLLNNHRPERHEGKLERCGLIAGDLQNANCPNDRERTERRNLRPRQRLIYRHGVAGKRLGTRGLRRSEPLCGPTETS